jgi:hypothetical protein
MVLLDSLFSGLCENDHFALHEIVFLDGSQRLVKLSARFRQQKVPQRSIQKLFPGISKKLGGQLVQGKNAPL